MKIMNSKKSLLLLFLVVLPNYLFGAGGLTKVNTLFQKIETALSAAAVVVVTIAIMWAGYKVLFGGSTIREVAPPLLGAIVLGAAAEIASLLLA